MPAAAIPDVEAQRIVALERYGILDTLPEIEYDDLTLLASQICETPISLISLVASERQWFKSRRGFESAESPRSISFCAHAIHDEKLSEVPDATLDARFLDNELVTGEHHIRFYAGAPLITPDGLKLGTLCVIDRKPRELSDAQREALSALARQVVALLELRRSIKQLEISNRELKNQREEFRGFMDNSPLVAFSKDRAGRFIYGNKTWEESFGFSFAQLQGKTDFEWLPTEVAATVRQNDMLVLDENRVIQVIERVPTPANPTCEWLVFKFPIGHGQEVRLGGVALDLTELRRAEKLKDEFVAVVSHELRTPLTALRGSLGLLDNQVAGVLPNSAREMVQLALKNAERLNLLINDLLDIEKIESGPLRFEMAEIDLEKLLHSAIELNANYASPLGVQLELEPLAPALQDALVVGDEARLQQVLSNLLSNAAKWTPKGTTVKLRAQIAPDSTPANPRVLIEVQDAGPGVPAEFEAHIFERFSQADSSATREKSGTGLGLAISQAIIAQHGGVIAYRAPDVAAGCVGATFGFELAANLGDDSVGASL